MGKYLEEGYLIKHPSISGEYKIINKFEENKTTISYEAEFTNYGVKYKCILVEYYPESIVINRDEHGGLHYKNVKEFNIGKKKFIDEVIRRYELQMLREEKNGRVYMQNHFVFNNTAYLYITEYKETTLNDLTNISLIDKMKLCLEICESVESQHFKGYLSLDLRPKNICVLIRNDLSIVPNYDSVKKIKDIKAGNIVHEYYEHWSAPEQKNPIDYNEISEKSNIYSLGEIIFWCLFGRNSNDEEQRLNSTYIFENSIHYLGFQNKPKIKELLTKLFNNTICSSPDNRFESVENIRILLISIIEELEKEKINIINSSISSNSFFVGRERELLEIDDILKNYDLLVVSGIDGIGKSEIVKKYISNKENEFDNILLINYQKDLETTISSNIELQISNIPIFEKENYEEYAIRKLNILSECLTENSIFVIDNISVPFDKMNKNLLSIIKNLKCKKVFVSRCIEEEYKQVLIEEIKEKDSIVEIFNNYCSYENDEKQYVEELIEMMNYHTLLVELISKQINELHISPKEMYDKLNNISDGEVSLQEDNIDSVYKYISQLYVINEINFEKRDVLLMLSLLCPIGIKIEDLISLFTDNEAIIDEINWFARNGWINLNGEFISIHPCVQQTIISISKKYNDSIECFFEKIINNTNLNNQLFYEVMVNNIIYFNINSKNSLIFIHKFMCAFGNEKIQKKYKPLNDFFIDNYKKYVKEYSALLEIAYLNKEILGNRDYTEIHNYFDLHIKKCKMYGDKYVEGLWILQIINYLFDDNKLYKLKFMKYNYRIKVIISYFNYENKHVKSNDDDLLHKLDYNYISAERKNFLLYLSSKYISMYERDGLDILFFSNYSSANCVCLNWAIKKRKLIRKNYGNILSNDTNLLFGLARIEYLQLNYKEALYYLFEIVKIMNEKNIENYLLFKVYWLIAHIYSDIFHRENAKNYYEKAYKLSNKLDVTNNFEISIEYYNSLAWVGYYEEALCYNMKLLEEIKNYPKDRASTYESEVLLNIGICNYWLGNYKSALKFLRNSINILDDSISPIERKTFIAGECYTYAYLIVHKIDREQAEECYQEAINNFKKSLNDDHPRLKMLYSFRR